MQTCWQERSRGWVVAVVVCLHVVEGGVKQITQEDNSREKKADAGGTYGSPHAQRMRQA